MFAKRGPSCLPFQFDALSIQHPDYCLGSPTVMDPDCRDQSRLLVLAHLCNKTRTISRVDSHSLQVVKRMSKQTVVHLSEKDILILGTTLAFVS